MEATTATPVHALSARLQRVSKRRNTLDTASLRRMQKVGLHRLTVEVWLAGLTVMKSARGSFRRLFFRSSDSRAHQADQELL